MADEEPVDPKKELEERCKAPCMRPLKEYQACAKRIQGDESGQKHCTDNTLTIGAVSINVLRLSYSPILNNRTPHWYH